MEWYRNGRVPGKVCAGKLTNKRSLPNTNFFRSLKKNIKEKPDVSYSCYFCSRTAELQACIFGKRKKFGSLLIHSHQKLLKWHCTSGNRSERCLLPTYGVKGTHRVQRNSHKFLHFCVNNYPAFSQVPYQAKVWRSTDTH